MKRQEELLAAFELRMVADRYAVAVDRGDGALFAAQFTPDGVLVAPRGRFVGREQLATVPPMMKRLYERTHHGVVAMVPVFDGGRATAQTYTYARHYNHGTEAGGEYCYEMTIRYEDFRPLRRRLAAGEPYARAGRRRGLSDRAQAPLEASNPQPGSSDERSR